MREEHRILDRITLPVSSDFWNEYFPPNGWNCRCEAIQVSKKRYEPSNPSEALARGRAATYKPNADGVNKAAIFRFNPGKEQRIFPKKHPYFPKGCGDCELNQYAIGNNNPQCAACALLQKGKKDHINDINTIVKQQIIPNLNYSHPDLPEIAKANKKTAGELTWHKSTSLNLIKTYDILEHIDKYLTSDADIFEEKVVYQHNTKTEVTNMYVLQSKYKGDLSFRKNEIIQLLFRRELAKNDNPYIRLYYIRDWKSEKDYLDWKKKTGR